MKPNTPRETLRTDLSVNHCDYENISGGPSGVNPSSFSYINAGGEDNLIPRDGVKIKFYFNKEF